MEATHIADAPALVDGSSADVPDALTIPPETDERIQRADELRAQAVRYYRRYAELRGANGDDADLPERVRERLEE